MEDCLFCKIINGDIPSKKVYEDDMCYAFYDIAPAAPIHFLVIPKEHIASAAELTPENSAAVARVFEAIAKVAKRDGLGSGFRVVNNCGEDAGESAARSKAPVPIARPRVSAP